MKIALILNVFSNSSVFYYVLQTVKVLYNGGIDITIIRDFYYQESKKLEKELDEKIQIEYKSIISRNPITRILLSRNYRKYEKLFKLRDNIIKKYDLLEKERNRLKSIFSEYDIIHFPQQEPYKILFELGKPLVINPHDFQHEHFPEYFSEKIIKHRRNYWYNSFRKAAALVVHGDHIAEDCVKYAKVKEEKIFFAPYGVFEYSNEISNIDKYNLPENFLFYPAHTWWHKNHLRVIDALHILKKRGIVVPIVFTDCAKRPGKEIERKIKILDLKDQVIITGHIDFAEIKSIYKKATAIIVPSLYEQQSGPILESIGFGKPILASKDIADNNFYVKKNGLLFNPFSPRDIASKIEELWLSLKPFEIESKKIKKKISWNEYIKNYKKAYEFAIQSYKDGECYAQK